MNFHLDTFDLVVDSPRLPQLAGKQLHLKVHVGFATMMGQARFSCSYPLRVCGSEYLILNLNPLAKKMSNASGPGHPETPYSVACHHQDRGAEDECSLNKLLLQLSPSVLLDRPRELYNSILALVQSGLC